MPTEVVHSIRASGGDYTSLSAWEAAQQRNLVTADEIAVAECYNDWTGDGLHESAGVTIAGWTTDATRKIIIRAAAGHSHGGIPGAGFRMWKFDNSPFMINQQHVRVENIEVRCTEDGNGVNYGLNILQPNIEIHGVIASASWNPFYADTNSFTEGVTLTSCLALPAGPVKAPIGFSGASAGFNYMAMFNCVAGPGCSTGFSSHYLDGFRRFKIRNCVSYGATVNSFLGAVDLESSNNAASNGATVTPPGSNPYTSDVVSGDFVDAAGGDFHLSASSGLIGQGVDLSGSFTTDVDGDTWPSGSAWDIGFDHYVAAGGTTPTLSNPLMTALTALGGVPQITLTF